MIVKTTGGKILVYTIHQFETKAGNWLELAFCTETEKEEYTPIYKFFSKELREKSSVVVDCIQETITTKKGDIVFELAHIKFEGDYYVPYYKPKDMEAYVIYVKNNR